MLSSMLPIQSESNRNTNKYLQISIIGRPDAILTVPTRAKTTGNAKLLITNPIVMKIDSSKHGVVPDSEFSIVRLAIKVGTTDKT